MGIYLSILYILVWFMILNCTHVLALILCLMNFVRNLLWKFLSSFYLPATVLPLIWQLFFFLILSWSPFHSLFQVACLPSAKLKIYKLCFMEQSIFTSNLLFLPLKKEELHLVLVGQFGWIWKFFANYFIEQPHHFHSSEFICSALGIISAACLKRW